MDHVLNTINHTTLEALGFSWCGSNGHWAQGNDDYKRADVFYYGSIKAVIQCDGTTQISIADIPVDVTLDELKEAINTYKAVNTSDGFIALARQLVLKSA